MSSSLAVIGPVESNTAADGPLRLREAELADAATVVSLIHAAFEEYRGVLDPPPAGLSETPASVRAHIKRGDAGVLLVELKGQAVGCVFYAAHPADGFVHLGRLSVHPTARGCGVGNVLIAGVEARARQLGYHRVHLGTRALLADKRAWYERLGFRVVAETPLPGHAATPSSPLILMEKRLGIAP